MNSKVFNWFIFICLSLIWGSSFILMKEGLVGLNAYQVASVRIISSGLVLLPVALRHIGKIPSKKLLIIFLSGVLGSLLPAYLFCVAEEHIDSALAGTLNALTPVFMIIAGVFFFKNKVSFNNILGIIISLTGSVLLFFAQPGFHERSNLADVLLIVAATIMYGFNVNMVGKYLKDIPSLHIAAIALMLNAVPAAIVLICTGYFGPDLWSAPMLISTGYACLLGIMGTAVASIIFYMLIKRTGGVFSSMVTYVIPLVAVMWGLLLGESLGRKQVVCLFILLTGVYIANKKNKEVA